jgi:hypothetical protein
LQLAIDIAAFSGRDLAEFFSLEYCPVRTYFTAQMTRQKKWAEEKSAQLFYASSRPVRSGQTLDKLEGSSSESAVSSTSAKLVL